MRILYMKLKGYIGIYNGLGLDEIEIDFSKCKNKILVIKGSNGSGKSTLWKAMSHLPDSNDQFIPNKSAYKIFMLEDNGIVYKFKLIHDVKVNGDRQTTKAYITKALPDGTVLELNPNGNISSFKEISESELCLDANFIALSQLSSSDRGLADKKPSERKKFIGNIVENIQVYNNMNKTLTKRGSVFKSMVNSLIGKINNIGDEEALKNTLVSIENRINKLNEKKELCIQVIANNRSKVQLLDPDGSIQESYQSIYNKLVKCDEEYKESIERINVYLPKIGLNELDENKIRSIYNNTKKEIDNLLLFIRVTESDINSLLNKREEEAKTIQSKSAKLQSLEMDINYKDLLNFMEVCNNNISNYNKIIDDIGIKDINVISKEEFIIGLNTLKEVKEILDIFKSYSDVSIVNKSIQYIKSETYPEVENIRQEIDTLKELVQTKSSDIQYYNLLKQTSNKLNLRPSNCKIDTCEFIKDAVDAFKMEPDKNIDLITSTIQETTNTINVKLKELDENVAIVECINYIKSILRNLNKHASILNKLPVESIYFNNELFLNALSNNYKFDEIDTLYRYIEYANIIEEYKIQVNKLDRLNKDYEIYQSKNDIINEIISDIDSLNDRLRSITIKIDESKDELLKSKVILSKHKQILGDCEFILELLYKKKEIENDKNILISNFNSIKTNITIIKECISNINLNEAELNKINSEINPIILERDTIKHGLSLLSEYNQEMEIYSNKFNKVEVIKKHSSPTKGIQTLFINMYMNKTLVMANELLQLMFGGEFILGNYIINEDEFKIPCIGEGIPNDDISSMSTSQICMISMILSFVLLQQSSTKYNILKLDEIDGGLDTVNRIRFITVLFKLIDVFNIEQSIMISHNNELNLDDCDLILLKMPEGDTVNGGNVIYKY